MLDFRPKGARTRNYLNRREQRRLLLMVFSAGLVMLLIQEANKPKHWAWIAGGPALAPPKGNGRAPRMAPRQARPLAARPADAEMAEAEAARPAPLPARRALGPDEFIIEGELQIDLPVGKQYFRGVRADLLGRVRDDTVFRWAEAGSFYNLLEVLTATREDDLERASLGDVSFTQLYTQPKEFRGDLVTLSGTVRRVHVKRLAANESGVAEYYQVVLEPSDRSYPVVIYCLELPEGFPIGEKLDEPATLTGFFYKRWAHLSGEGIATWPLLLSKTIRWRPEARPAVVARAPVNGQTLLAATLIAMIVSLFVVLFALNRTRFRLAGKPGRPPQLSALKHAELAPDVREQLAELAQAESEDLS